MGKRPWPNWTVVYSITRPGGAFIGKGWEFFYNEDAAKLCYDKQIEAGNVLTKRPFHPDDKQHMNVVDVWECRDI